MVLGEDKPDTHTYSLELVKEDLEQSGHYKLPLSLSCEVPGWKRWPTILSVQWVSMCFLERGGAGLGCPALSLYVEFGIVPVAMIKIPSSSQCGISLESENSKSRCGLIWLLACGHSPFSCIFKW